MQIKAKEHEIINQPIALSIAEYNHEFLNNSPKYLGIHQELSEKLEPIIMSHYFIGCRWLNEECSILVSPKEYKGKCASYISMFMACLNDPIVSQKLEDTYEIFFNEKWIDIESSEDYITPFLIVHFLQIVKKITLKGLKKGYVKTTENMTSKVKGKILINQTIKTNLFKNRLDKTVCEHQIFTINCIENKIIKSALTRCAKYLASIAKNEFNSAFGKIGRMFALKKVVASRREIPGVRKRPIDSLSTRAWSLSNTEPSASIKYSIPASCKAFVKSLCGGAFLFCLPPSTERIKIAKSDFVNPLS